jgi:hypothetical protein
MDLNRWPRLADTSSPEKFPTTKIAPIHVIVSSAPICNVSGAVMLRAGFRPRRR